MILIAQIIGDAHSEPDNTGTSCSGGNMSESNSANSSLGTIVAIVGLLMSLAGNYVQYRKNANDEQIAKQQIEIAQQQATIAREEFTLKQKELEGQQAMRRQTSQNCNQKRAEHDDALNAVHIYDESITKNETRLAVEKSQLAMAQNSHEEFHVAEHRSLVDTETDAIKSLRDSRDNAMARVRDLEKECGF